MAKDGYVVHLESKDFNCDKVKVDGMTGHEAISELYRFDVHLIVDDSNGLDLSTVLGATVTLNFERQGIVVRRVHGMIATVDDELRLDVPYRVYKVQIVPRAHRLTLVEMLDVHVNETVPDVIKAKFAAAGLDDAFELRLRGKYEPREFIVQYKETDLAFVSRLAEHLGISYFFEQTETSDRIVFTDHIEGFPTAHEAFPFRKSGERRDVFDVQLRREVVPSMFVVQDYNYRTPTVDLSASHELPVGFGGGISEYGGHFKTQDAARQMATVRAEERQTVEEVYSVLSDSPVISAGLRITIDGHPRLEKNHLLVTTATHDLQLTEATVEGQRVYENKYKAIPADRTFRPRRTTPRPRIPGVVTGIVDSAGAQGSNEIARIDDQGRYWVRLLFDTGGTNRRASHPIRMAQPHAGPGYGQHFPLKPGVEVIVVFVEGDPDRPVISGAVPNPLNPSPVTASDATVNRIRTQSGISIEMHDR